MKVPLVGARCVAVDREGLWATFGAMVVYWYSASHHGQPGLLRGHADQCRFCCMRRQPVRGRMHCTHMADFKKKDLHDKRFYDCTAAYNSGCLPRRQGSSPHSCQAGVMRRLRHSGRPGPLYSMHEHESTAPPPPSAAWLLLALAPATPPGRPGNTRPPTLGPQRKLEAGVHS